jgi:hypothetical protein
MDPLERLADRIAVQDEHSHADDSVRKHVREVILDQEEREELTDTALRIAQALSEQELAAIVADWLDVQIAI